MEAQYINTDKNDRLVIIPEQEYQALIKIADEFEGAVDVIELRGKLNNQFGKEEENFSFDLIKELSEGIAHPIKIYRKYRGLKSKELAEKVGISAAYLSEIENRKKDGTLKTCAAIAKALDVDIDDLVEWN